jgi:hypothetical protein
VKNISKYRILYPWAIIFIIFIAFEFLPSTWERDVAGSALELIFYLNYIIPLILLALIASFSTERTAKKLLIAMIILVALLAWKYIGAVSPFAYI